MASQQQLRVHAFSISLDGYGAGPEQSLKEPLGRRGEELHEWMFPTETFGRLYGDGKGTTGIDDDFARKGFEGIGAWILGRNMFGPVRGEWPAEEWKGWWGDNPPYHSDVFVLTHHPRASFEMEGGTTFHFVTDGIESALRQAFEAADGKDVRLGGGAATIQQYLRSGLVDYLHLAISPVILGGGERLFAGLPDLGAAYTCTLTSGELAVHAEMMRK